MAIGNEFYLPQELIHHIQSFLNARELAQSSVLAKSWYSHILNFDENLFPFPPQNLLSHQFSDYCIQTLNRYKTRNLKLEKFTLHLTTFERDFSLRNKLARQLIISALELGVGEIELKLNNYRNFDDFDFRYDLPAQVFASTSLIHLSVDRYVIDGVIGDIVLCSCLKSLKLDKVKTTDDIVRDILARCPLIEYLDLCECVGIGKLNVSKLINLVEFRAVNWKRLKVEFMDFDGMNVTEFCCLRRLHLENVSTGAEFFSRFGSMFPCVEDLTLGYCGDYDEINSSIHSLSLYQPWFDFKYDLHAQVFASTSLRRLSVNHYVIDGVIGDRVFCSRLKSLVLDKVKTTDDIVRDILARCPLIENLDLCHCDGIGNLNVSKLIKLVGFRYVEGAGVRVEFMDLERMNETKFRCLRRLHLEKVCIGAEFFNAFGSMFPCVEDLTLGYCGDYDEISISSHSVRRLKFCQVERLKKVQLNVPNMSKFEFVAGWDDIDMKGTYFKPLPYLSFDNVSRDWESDVQLLRSCDVIDACWFEDLRKFLVQLARSRISLLVYFTGDNVIFSEDIPGFNAIAEVETLKVCTCCSDELNTTERLLLGLSRSCRFDSFTECNECQI